MRLVVDLDGDMNWSTMPACIILTRKGTPSNCPHIILPFLIHSGDQIAEIADEVNRLFMQLPPVYAPLINGTYMKVIRTVCALLCQINKIIVDYSISEIYIEGGSCVPFYALEGGEGEGRHFMFKVNWLINSVLFSYYNNEISVVWKKKENAYYLGFIFILRSSIYYIKFIKRLIFNRATPKSIIWKTSQGTECIGFVNSDIQMNYLKNILNHKGYNSVHYFSPFSNTLIKNNSIFKINPTISDYFSGVKKVCFGAKSQIKTYRFDFNLSGSEFIVDLKLLSVAMSFNLIEYYAALSALLKIIDRNNYPSFSAFYSNMTFGYDIILVSEVASVLGVKHINFQAGAMEKMLFPSMQLAHSYYLYNKKIFDFYSQFNSSYKFFFPVARNNSCNQNIRSLDVVTLGLFTQPDHYTDKYLKFIQLFCSSMESQKIHVNLIIKPHYREVRIDDYMKVAKLFSKNNYVKISIADKMGLPEETMKVCTFMLSITSSVLFEAIQIGCPGIILGLYKEDNEYIADACFPEVNYFVQSVDEVVEIICNSVYYIDNYLLRRSAFVDLNDSF